MAKIAFIGLGNMGLPMSINLLKGKHQVTGFDLNPQALEHFQQQGGQVAKSVVDAVKNVDVVISMLPSGKHVEGIYLDTHQGVIGKAAANTLFIDCSTIDAATAKKVAIAANNQGYPFVDAPVSGGTAGAMAGTLTFICGGTEPSFEQAKLILADMGANIFHAGGAGAGQIAKICNNMLLSVLMIGTSEALSMGIDNGLNPKVLSEIMKVSSGGNWTLDKYNPCPGVMEKVPASNEYQGGFMVDLMVKDLGLAMDTSLLHQSSTPMGTLARNLYAMHANQGHGQRDFSSIFEQFTKLNKTN